MKKTNMTGKTCVGELRLSALDVGFDLRLHGYEVDVPNDCTSAGYDEDGVTWLIEGTADEIRAELRRAGYKVLDSERINRLE